MVEKLSALKPSLSHEGEDEELEMEPQLAATIPFVTTPSGQVATETAIELEPEIESEPVITQSSNHLKTPVDIRRSNPLKISSNGVPLRTRSANGRIGMRPKSWNGSPQAVPRTPEARSLSIYDMYQDTSRRPSALDILSCQGSESAAAAVAKAKERRELVLIMHKISLTLLYILPTLIVLVLVVYWAIDGGDDHKWLTMLALVLGCACFIDFIFYQYFVNRRDGTDLQNTVARFRARLKRSGRRF